jgi:hypothetical protein
MRRFASSNASCARAVRWRASSSRGFIAECSHRRHSE